MFRDEVVGIVALFSGEGLTKDHDTEMFPSLALYSALLVTVLDERFGDMQRRSRSSMALSATAMSTIAMHRLLRCMSFVRRNDRPNRRSGSRS